MRKKRERKQAKYMISPSADIKRGKMEKRLIGNKKAIPIWLHIVLIAGGAALIAGTIVLFTLVFRPMNTQGMRILGGLIAGVGVGVGVILIWQSISMIITPKELIHIDQYQVVIRNRITIPLNAIVSVTAKGSTIIIFQSIGRPINQPLIDNALEVAEIIKQAAASASGVTPQTANEMKNDFYSNSESSDAAESQNDFFSAPKNDENETNE